MGQIRAVRRLIITVNVVLALALLSPSFLFAFPQGGCNSGFSLPYRRRRQVVVSRRLAERALGGVRGATESQDGGGL